MCKELADRFKANILVFILLYKITFFFVVLLLNPNQI